MDVVVIEVEDDEEDVVLIDVDVLVISIYFHAEPVYKYNLLVAVSKYILPAYTSSPVGADVAVSTCIACDRNSVYVELILAL